MGEMVITLEKVEYTLCMDGKEGGFKFVDNRILHEGSFIYIPLVVDFDYIAEHLELFIIVLKTIRNCYRSGKYIYEDMKNSSCVSRILQVFKDKGIAVSMSSTSKSLVFVNYESNYRLNSESEFRPKVKVNYIKNETTEVEFPF